MGHKVEITSFVANSKQKIELNPSWTLVKTLNDKMNLLKTKFGEQQLSIEDMRQAESPIILFEKRHYFSQEHAVLENGGQVRASSSICKLDPILDEGLPGVGGKICI